MANENIKAGKKLNTRISLKMDTWDNWNTADGQAVVLLKGEVAFVQVGAVPPTPSDGDTHNGILNVAPNSVLFKVGDGTTPFKDLVWGGAVAADVYDWAKAKNVSFNATSGKIEFRDASNELIKDIDLSGLATDTDLTNLETKLTGLINAGGTANEQLAARVEAIENAPYATEEFATNAANTAAGNVLGKSGDAATANTVYGAKAAAATAKSAADGVSTELSNFKTTVSSTYATKNELTTAQTTLQGNIDKKADSDNVYTKTAADDKFATITTVGGINTTVGEHTTKIGNIETAISKLGDTYATDAELEGVRSTLQSNIDGKVAQSAYNTKVAALEDEDERLAGLIQTNTTNISTLTTNSATKEELNQAVAGLKGTKATGDTTAETIAGAKAYADAKITDLLNAYILDDGGTTDAIDKLQEIAAWIADDKAGAAKIIADLETKASATDLSNHKSATNPHNITPTLLGVYTKTESDNKFASKANLISGDIVVKSANNAANATNAVSANKATKDGDGNVITSTYETIANADLIRTRVSEIEDFYLRSDDYFWIDCGSATVNIT